MKPELAPFQAEFVERFFNGGAARKQVLTSATGTGKTRVATTIVEQGVRAGEFSRVLIVAPFSSLLDQFIRVLESKELPLPLVRLTKSRFRLMESGPHEGPGWGDSFIAVVTSAVLRQPSVAERITQVHWDLVVVDEAHVLGQDSRSAVIELAQSPVIDRFLMLSATSRATNRFELLSGAEAGRYSFQDAIRPEALSLQAVEFTREPMEIEILTRLVGLIETHSLRRYRARARRVLLGAASASMYSAQTVLLRERHQLQTVGASWPSDPPEDVEDSFPDHGEINWWHHRSVALGLISSMIQDLDTIHVDLKLAALNQGLREQMSGVEVEMHISLITSDSRTADYLREAVDKQLQGPSTRATTGSGPPNRTVTVLTDKDLRVLDASATTAWFFYDPPASDSALERRRGRALSAARIHPVAVYYLHDSTDSNPVEKERARRYKRFISD